MRGLILFFILTWATLAYADIDEQALLKAIYKAEGGARATYLYGIRSIKYKDAAEARQICLNSIRNNIKRWEKAGRPEDFITFMSRRYCPVGCDNDRGTNKYWVKNVRYWYEKGD